MLFLFSLQSFKTFWVVWKLHNEHYEPQLKIWFVEDSILGLQPQTTSYCVSPWLMQISTIKTRYWSWKLTSLCLHPSSTDYFRVLDPIRKKHMVLWLIILVLFYQQSCKHRFSCNIFHKNVENVYIKKIDIAVRDSAVRMRVICINSIFLCSSLGECAVKAEMTTDKYKKKHETGRSCLESSLKSLNRTWNSLF